MANEMHVTLFTIFQSADERDTILAPWGPLHNATDIVIPTLDPNFVHSVCLNIPLCFHGSTFFYN